MFKDDYKKANESLKPDEKIINAISAGIATPSSVSAEKIQKFPLKRVIAAVASIAIILGALAVYPFIVPDKNALKPSQTAKTSQSNPNVSSPIDDDVPINGEATSKKQELDDSAAQDGDSSETAQPLRPNSSYQGSEEEFDPDDWKEIVDTKYHKLYSVFNKHINYIMLETDALVDDSEQTDMSEAAPGTNSSTKGDSIPTSEEVDYSGTNNQVSGVDEADIVKTDGKYIYRIIEKNSNSNYLTIFKTSGEKTEKISSIKIKSTLFDNAFSAREMFLKNDKIFIIGASRYTSEEKNSTGILTYDVSNRAKPKFIDAKHQLGYYVSSRLLGDSIYVVSNETSYYSKIDPSKKKDYLPYCFDKNGTMFFAAEDIYFEEKTDARYTVVCSYSTKTSKLVDNIAILGGGENVYMNTEYLLCSGASYYNWSEGDYRDKTSLNLFEISKGKIEHKAHTTFAGYLLNQFSMDIYKEHLRLVATVRDKNYNQSNSLLIFDMDLKKTGKITGLAKDERIYSARFQGDIAYFVTYRETDPLFCADVSNPKNPKILSALKIPGFSTYLHPYGDGLLLGFGEHDDPENGDEDNLKLSMFDTSNLKDVKEITTKLICNTQNYEYPYSDALYEHKAIFVSPEKNIIGFGYSAMDASRGYPYEYKQWYSLYEYTEQGFKLMKKISLSSKEDTVRGLYIGNYYYISTSKTLKVLDMNTWETVKIINL